MLRTLRELLTYLRCLIPPGPKATAKQVYAWRWAIAIIAVSALVIVSAANDWIPRVTGFAHAYAEDVDDKIEKALAPVNARLTSIETSQTAQGNYITRLVKSDIAKDIHADKIAWCRADTSSEKQRLRERLDELQEEYEEAAGKGKRATEPDCE